MNLNIINITTSTAKDCVFHSENINTYMRNESLSSTKLTLRLVPRYSILFIFIFLSFLSYAHNLTRIACVGNSITYGATLENREINCYPAQLAAMLGNNYQIRNFGENGATLLRKGNISYWNSNEYKQALDFKPDWVLIELGTNDSNPINRVFLNEFVQDYKDLISSFQQLPSHPRVILLLPPPVFLTDTTGITSSVVSEKIMPLIRQVAYETGCEVINLYNLLIESPQLFPDKVHPSVAGATLISKRLDELIRMKSDQFNINSIRKYLPKGTLPFNFYGFQGYDFTFRNRNAKILVPKQIAPGQPWVWRARFWGHEPQTDIALLERGFYIVYCDVAELFANEEALSIWNDYYQFLTHAGLAKKAVMEGMSRGGVYVYRWTAMYPERVAAIYADAPVLDLKSWPGGKGKGEYDPEAWGAFKKDFNIETEDDALTFKGNPIDLTEQIVKAGAPMLHVVGDADNIVPVAENTAPFEQKIREAGGSIQVIHKPGVGHHPHSLQNPQPIVDFILSNYFLKQSASQPRWSLILKQPGKKDIELVRLPELSKPFRFQKNIEGVQIKFTLVPKADYTVFKATASFKSVETNLYFSLKCNYGSQNMPYNFNGEVKSTEIFRQSPHDVNAWIVKNIAEQAVPMVAIKGMDSAFFVALNGSPALYNNFTSQVFNIDRKTIELSSGDNGEMLGLKPDTTVHVKMDYNTDNTQIMAPGKILAYYHRVSKNNPHIFEGILFKKQATSLIELRKDVIQFAADHYSGRRYTDYFGALAFTTAYMNLRVNETGKSKYWVVPSVEYGNTQYCRDAFWISTMLDPEYSAECLKNELTAVNTYAEYPLMAVIWAYRAYKEGQEVDLTKVQAYINSIETRVRNNYFYSYTEKDGRLDFQYWADGIAFDKDDVITYNQGLFALTLSAAKEMGLQIKSDPAKALQQYRDMFNSKLGFYPISKKKNTIMGPDPLVPDLLSQIYFNRKMLDDATVVEHYNRMIKYSKTNFGFKDVSLPNGEYLPGAMYDVKNYISQVNRDKGMTDGSYLKGGSWFLYDNLFLIDAYLHGVKEAEDELIWRVSLDFKIGATTYECLNTKTGEPWKPNMGWNVAIYSIWRKLVSEGKASNRLFDSIDQIMKTNK